MFKNREEAGKKLAQRLEKYSHQKECIVVGLARGGVVVAAEVAKALALPLNVVVARKVGAPHNPELAIGAVLESGEGYFNESLIRELGVSKRYLEEEVAKERGKAAERASLYAKYAPRPLFRGKSVILVDDGIATGATIFASIHAIQKQGPFRLIAAIPVSSAASLQAVESMADEVVCLEIEDFGSVSMSYENFSQTEDKDVIALISSCL